MKQLVSAIFCCKQKKLAFNILEDACFRDDTCPALFVLEKIITWLNLTNAKAVFDSEKNL